MSRSIARLAVLTLAFLPACHRQTAASAEQAVLERRREGRKASVRAASRAMERDKGAIHTSRRRRARSSADERASTVRDWR